MKHTFLKHTLWTALFVAGAALAQDAAISGADFTHGKADAQLASIGGKAAAAGQAVVVTAPSYWQAKVAAKIRAGAHGKPIAIRFSNGFYENVLVRTEATAPAVAAAKPEPRPVAKPEARPQPKVATQAESKPKPAAKTEPRVVKAEPKPEPKVVPAPSAEPPQPASATAMRASIQQPVVAKSQIPTAPRVTSNIVAVPQVSRQPAVVPIPTAAIETARVEPSRSDSQAGTSTDARQHLLASLNDGRPAMGSLSEAQLQPGDQVYAAGDTRAVVRLEGLHRSLYWLQGPVDLQRVQYKPQGEGHYEVTGPIDPKSPAAHRVAANAHHVVASKIPTAGSAARTRLEQQYNNGQPMTGTVTVGRLQPEDRLLVDGGAIIVARRDGNSMSRYWLDGSIDLGQSGIQKVDGNVYRVIGDALH